MDLSFTKEQELIRKIAREFAEAELKPVAAELDKTCEFPHEIIRKMGKIGLMGIPIPREYGGAGADTISYILAIEEISRICAATGIIMAVHTSVGTYPIYQFGNEEQKQKYLPKLASGQIIGAFALTEPNAGSDIGGVQTTAEKDGDYYILNGTKTFITNGSVAGTVIVLAVTDKSKGSHGLSTFIVEKDTKGFTYGTSEKKMGINASESTELVFENCCVSKNQLLGVEGAGLRIALSVLDGGRVGVAAQAIGIARAVFEECLKYSREREQFGRPIGKFQAIQWMLADMATELEASKLLTYRAAYLKDKGQRFTKEASMAKLYATEFARKSAILGVQIHGGYGYTKDYPVERFFRDAKVTEIYEGTNEIQRLVIANNLLR